MSNTASHPAVLAAADFGAKHAAAIAAKGDAANTLEGWSSAKLFAAIQFGHSCRIDPDALSLAADVANAFTTAATGKALSGASLGAQGRKFAAFGKLGGGAYDLVTHVSGIVANLVARGSVKDADPEDRANAKRATTRVFEKATSLARLAGRLGTVRLADADVMAVLCDGEAPSLAKNLGAAVKSLEKALVLDPDATWAPFLATLRAEHAVAHAAETKAKERADADRRALEAAEAEAEAMAARDKLRASQPEAGLLAA